MKELIKALSRINGVVAVGLGGSRGLRIADENSDYDFVLFRASGEPIAAPLIANTVIAFADAKTVRMDADFVVGEVSGKKIELFQKDLSLVAKEISMARAGKFRWFIRRLFPHGDLSTAMISHIIYLELCAEKNLSVSNLKRLAEPYPEPLMRSSINFFMTQAAITLTHAGKIKKAADLQYLLALCSAFIFFANIVIFSINKRYPVLERGGARIILNLPLRPKDYEQRMAKLFQACCGGEFGLVMTEMSAIMEELKALKNTTS